MEESQTSSKKRRRNSAEKLLAKQKDYTFSSEDLLTLDHWEQTLKNQRTRSTYIGAILLVCDYYRKPIHEITPEEWVLYVNSVKANHHHNIRPLKKSARSLPSSLLV